jgi:hypothetical protein
MPVLYTKKNFVPIFIYIEFLIKLRGICEEDLELECVTKFT